MYFSESVQIFLIFASNHVLFMSALLMIIYHKIILVFFIFKNYFVDISRKQHRQSPLQHSCSIDITVFDKKKNKTTHIWFNL